MVGCESENCKIEWFHYACVGLADDAPEPEVWYCPDCRDPTTTTTGSGHPPEESEASAVADSTVVSGGVDDGLTEDEGAAVTVRHAE